ncbi:hypothetical protein [Budvicia aquatica]|uniref:Zinc ABC transporter substrate-binding protein n=1 Tax=Budvicia aquatica TaxID=82979 RepID=A0A2C6CW69_9GAMM|nr:hypothetical protein [Budvicia aquatica]PHI30899.1 zinc ABC transporter substrate-binding protein [Budvicia aquatica]VFS50803.1 Uncharacterised protein [Budvicia aquatica]
MDKNEVYVRMLALVLPYIRNIQTLSKKEKSEDESCYFEAELVHNLVYTILEKEFKEHDIYFLNNQARFYFEKCSSDLSPNYEQHIKYIKYLFDIVPEDLSQKLIWAGP